MTRRTTRLERRSAGDLLAIERATHRIRDLTATLDGQLDGDPRSERQLGHIRQATTQITRSANDAIQAYRRVSEALRQEGEHGDGDDEEIERTARTLAELRAEMLSALDAVSRRYPWGTEWRSVAPK